MMKNRKQYTLAIGCFFALQTVFSQVEIPMKLNIQNLDWSPDGKSLVLSAIHVKSDWSDFDGKKWQVLLLDLESGKLQRLATGATFPAFSPDGNKIAYGKLNASGHWDIETYDRTTGKRARLTPAPGDEQAPAWSPDGSQIVFHDGSRQHHELYVTDTASGSIPHRLTHVSPDAAAYNPDWSPSGDHIVYYLEKGDHHDQLWLTDPAGSFFKNITNDTMNNIYPGWTQAGDLVFSSNRQAVERMDADGRNRQKVEDVNSFYARFSPDGKQIAWVEGRDKPAVFIKNFPAGEPKAVFSQKEYEAWYATQFYCVPCSCPHDGMLFEAPGNCPSCQMKLLPAGVHSTEWVSPLPDGRIAFTTTDEYGISRIFISETDGSGKVQVAKGSTPECSPDGKRILYFEHDSICLISTDGKERFNLSASIGGVNLNTPVWSPDGRSIVLSEGEFPQTNIIQVSLETFEKKVLVQNEGPEYAPAISPDGKKIAYTQLSRVQTEKGIWLLDLASGQKLRLAEKGEYVNWSPDGKSLVYHAPDGEAFSIFKVGADAGNLTKLSTGGFDDELPRWSADGSRIFFQSKRSPQGNWNLYEMQPDGSGVKLLLLE